MSFIKLACLALLVALFAVQTSAVGRITTSEASELSLPSAVPPPPPPPASPSPSENSEGSDESSSSAGANTLNGLAGMGIAVVLKNRNHIRTIEDKSAEHVEREESRKQLAEEQKRKEHFRNTQTADEKARLERQEKEDKDRSDAAESGRKNKEEASVKKAQRDADDRKARREEADQKQQAKYDREKKAREQRDEQDEKERQKKAQQAQEARDKKAEDERNGVLQKDQFQPAQGRVLRDASNIPFTGSFTYMFWLRPLAAQAPWSNIFHKGQQDGNRNPAVWFHPGRTMLHVRSGTGNGNWNDGCDTRDVSIGQWTHITIIHSAAGLKVYYDGSIVCDRNYGPPIENAGALYCSNPWYTPARCDLYDFRFLSRVAGDDQIRAAVDKKPPN